MTAAHDGATPEGGEAAADYPIRSIAGVTFEKRRGQWWVLRDDHWEHALGAPILDALATAEAALAAERERADRAETDAARWRFVEPMLESESDFTDDSPYAKSYSFVYAPGDFEKLCADGALRSVNEIVDAALASSRAGEVGRG